MKDRAYPVALGALPLVAQGAGDDGLRLTLGSILLYILIGAVIGVIARLIISGTGGMSWVVTIVVGIVGALIGGWLAGAIFEETEGVDWIASILVAALLVWIVARAGAGRWGTRRGAL
ncbi:MAG TPA: hypothetical protein VHL78_08690 [Actinomycetota bacterium]|nr:hypothetical protein [Actinomycetota bacterium]